MRIVAFILAIIIVIALILSAIGYAYAQGNESSSTGGCCAMAAAYDSNDDDNLNVIRQFRDEYLMTNPVGCGVVVLYYEVLSPPIAGFINDHPSVKPLARAAWAPVIAISSVAIDTTTTEKIAISGTLALILGGTLVWLRRRRKRRNSML